MSREALQEILNEAATKDNKIEGVVIFTKDNLPFLQSQTPGYGGNKVDANNFTMNIGGKIRDSLRRAADMGTGKPLYLIMVLEKALWTVFVITIAKQEFLLVFFLSDPDPQDAFGVHYAYCQKYKPQIEELLEDIFR